MSRRLLKVGHSHPGVIPPLLPFHWNMPMPSAQRGCSAFERTKSSTTPVFAGYSQPAREKPHFSGLFCSFFLAFYFHLGYSAERPELFRD
jgi:hypothetical protein